MASENMEPAGVMQNKWVSLQFACAGQRCMSVLPLEARAPQAGATTIC